MLEMLAPHHEPNTIYQQELEAIAGVDRRFLCGPAALLHLAREQGHTITPEIFVEQLDWAYWNGLDKGWSRAGLGQMLREQYGVASVSWWSHSTGDAFETQDLTRMERAGYVNSPVEKAFLDEIITTLPKGNDGVLELVANDCPVIATVEPGFAANKSPHAVVLKSYDKEQGTVTVFDPDARNSATEYSASHLQRYLADAGACTVILPRAANTRLAA